MCAARHTRGVSTSKRCPPRVRYADVPPTWRRAQRPRRHPRRRRPSPGPGPEDRGTPPAAVPGAPPVDLCTGQRSSCAGLSHTVDRPRPHARVALHPMTYRASGRRSGGRQSPWRAPPPGWPYKRTKTRHSKVRQARFLLTVRFVSVCPALLTSMVDCLSEARNGWLSAALAVMRLLGS